MQVPWRVDVGFMEVSCRFRCFLCLNVMVAWRLLPWRIDVEFHAVSMCVMEVMPLSTLVGFIMHSD